ncbi:uncharacterized protein K452DRAFT_147692 [Aplosporella prunicola CBS 121167]|uniref:Dethiobiotin synthase n=1 Tax=Aplosporella prunicola CBS 121167 TaxID=1176127 RepID=A0A6A6BMA9_9PEZI|nr:uncharacterized protein K452DRAFT_147692 [Aplosporella prunicola CBS 121167]KAF2144808.1 hypothetical protein K452DRAFT_147692 [Aplosporella prunicola CBS 121167]
MCALGLIDGRAGAYGSADFLFHLTRFFRHISWFAPGVVTKCLYQFEKPVSPHIAAALSKKDTPSDDILRSKLYDYVSECARAGPGWAFLETAGGVHSPGPSGTSQLDLYRALRAPVVLVADSRLGGISSTISAYESLKIRGYDVEAVMLFKDSEYQNHGYLKSYFDDFHTPSLAIPAPPSKSPNPSTDEDNMTDYYRGVSESEDVHDVLAHLARRHERRIKRLETMSSRAYDQIWWPFTQQKLLSPSTITSIDSANDDFFQTFQQQSAGQSEDLPAASPVKPLIKPSFDGSASWWTQGLGHANPKLTLAAAYAAGRYGHVMFAEAVHEPALGLAELLLNEMQNPRLQRVFFSDNGSTGTEVAVKMALRAARTRYGWDASEDLGILGLKGSYHGDTIGAMDCAEPCTYNEKIEWYSGKGFWFDFPTVKMVDGKWIVEVPETLQEALGPSQSFNSLDEIFDLETRVKGLACKQYEQFITATLEKLAAQGRKFGALMLEPVVLGAGGMLFADPLFQRALVSVVRRSAHIFAPSHSAPAPTGESNSSADPSKSFREISSEDQAVVKQMMAEDGIESIEEYTKVQRAPLASSKSATTWTGLPVVFDEVFTGLYRLGRFSSASFLGVHPDVSVHAKLLTGGLLPLCTTLASESVYDAFLSDDKTDALLHGHSYTAHAVGCTVATESVRTMRAMEREGAWDAFREEWAGACAGANATPAKDPAAVWSVWSAAFLAALSRSPRVDAAWALGSVLAITVRDEAGAGGYTSTAAKGVQAALADGAAGCSVHSRILGNVLYLMAGQKTSVETVKEVEGCVGAALGVRV